MAILIHEALELTNEESETTEQPHFEDLQNNKSQDKLEYPSSSVNLLLCGYPCSRPGDSVVLCS